MKKVMFLLVVLFSITSAKSQIKENVNLVATSIHNFQKTLNETKSRIYYLEVTLNSKIYEDSVKNLSNKKYLFDKANNLSKLQEEKFFAKDELVVLYDQRKMLEDTIKKLKESILSAEEVFTKNELSSNIPDRMTQFEYKQRTRAQMFKASDGKSQAVFPGLLVNYRRGRNEIAIFTITRIGFPEFSPIVKALNPEERLYVNLPIGDYKVDVRCGSLSGEVISRVRQNEIKHFDGQDVYWFAGQR